MGSISKSVRGRKQRVMGQATVQRTMDFKLLGREERIRLIRQLIPLGLMAVADELQREIDEIQASSLDPVSGKARVVRYGFNPGSVILGKQRVPIKVPRVRQGDQEIALESYQMLHREDDRDTLFHSILHGMSCRGYERTIDNHEGAISKSKSTVSRQFVEESSKCLKALQARALDDQRFVALFLDGKSFCIDQMVVALGITEEGKKVFLGFVQTATENKQSVALFLESLLSRGLDVSAGILAIIDGSRGFAAALKQVFYKKVLIQRCQWHKRENVVSYLPKGDQEPMRLLLQQAYDRPNLSEAEQALKSILTSLHSCNQSAAASLEEGLTETLTLHRLGVFAKLGKSFKTTNCLESANASIERICGKIDHWKNSSQKVRWLASALMDTEPRLHRIRGFEHLSALQAALKKELG